jgi:hypothetical protein
MDSVGNIDAFFNTIYGDRAMRLADFEKAKSYYEKAQKFGEYQERIMKDTILKPETMKNLYIMEKIMMALIIFQI